MGCVEESAENRFHHMPICKDKQDISERCSELIFTLFLLETFWLLNIFHNEAEDLYGCMQTGKRSDQPELLNLWNSQTRAEMKRKMWREIFGNSDKYSTAAKEAAEEVYY